MFNFLKKVVSGDEKTPSPVVASLIDEEKKSVNVENASVQKDIKVDSEDNFMVQKDVNEKIEETPAADISVNNDNTMHINENTDDITVAMSKSTEMNAVSDSNELNANNDCNSELFDDDNGVICETNEFEIKDEILIETAEKTTVFIDQKLGEEEALDMVISEPITSDIVSEKSSITDVKDDDLDPILESVNLAITEAEKALQNSQDEKVHDSRDEKVDLDGNTDMNNNDVEEFNTATLIELANRVVTTTPVKVALSEDIQGEGNVNDKIDVNDSTDGVEDDACKPVIISKEKTGIDSLGIYVIITAFISVVIIFINILIFYCNNLHVSLNRL